MSLNIAELLRQSQSDKESAHKYGFIYEYLFSTLLHRQKRKLKICEIGISKYREDYTDINSITEGSFQVWKTLDFIGRVVGIDILQYQGDISGTGHFYKMDAYSQKSLDRLNNQGETFDIIIDDGSHNPTHQRYFLDNYSQFLEEGGFLVCEDVFCNDLINEAKEQNLIIIDNLENVIPDYSNFDNVKSETHDHRLIIKEKAGTGRGPTGSIGATDDESKPHIARLPVVSAPEYERNSSELAISIPLFYSDLDTTFKPFNVDRFQNIHVKGAAWAAISLLCNSDIGAHGVPIYFHLEDTIWEYALPVFEKFNIPEIWLRKVSVEQIKPEYIMNKTNFGKKYIGLLDDGIDTDIMLVLDSDAFTLSEGEPIKLYDDLTTPLLKIQPAMTYNYVRKLRYEWYVHCIMMATGLPVNFTKNGGLNNWEQKAFERLGFEIPLERDLGKDDLVPRYYSENYMVTFPKGHSVRDFTIQNMLKCYCSPYIHSIWSHFNQPFLHLNDMINLPVYDFERPFLDAEFGYNCLAHIRRDKAEEAESGRNKSYIDEYYGVFYEHLTRNLIK